MSELSSIGKGEKVVGSRLGSSHRIRGLVRNILHMNSLVNGTADLHCGKNADGDPQHGNRCKSNRLPILFPLNIAQAHGHALAR